MVDGGVCCWVYGREMRGSMEEKKGMTAKLGVRYGNGEEVEAQLGEVEVREEFRRRDGDDMKGQGGGVRKKDGAWWRKSILNNDAIDPVQGGSCCPWSTALCASRAVPRTTPVTADRLSC